MRQICLDTETTGTKAEEGDRIVEIGCFEIVGRTLFRRPESRLLAVHQPRARRPRGRRRHSRPHERIPGGQTRFADIADDFLKFVEGAELVIHNAAFDVGFLNMELARIGKGKIEDYCPSIVDSLAIARQKYPGVRNSLDALCTRFEVDSSMRTLHGACLDARLLGEVYLAMTRSQDDLVEILNAMNRPKIVMPDNKLLLVAECPEEDLAEHKAFMERLRKKCKEHPPVWETVLGTFDNLDPALKTVASAAEETAESATK